MGLRDNALCGAADNGQCLDEESTSVSVAYQIHAPSVGIEKDSVDNLNHSFCG